MAAGPLLFVNVGWMLDYSGIRKEDPISGGFGYFDDHDHGHEAWNFAPLKGKLHGYIPGSRRVLLKNFGAATGASEVEGVTVVWIARHPSSKKTYIVGWYKNATIVDEPEHITRAPGYKVEYRIEAPVAGHVLLEPDERTYPIPTAKRKGNLGQSPVWYGGTEKFRDEVRRYIATGVNPHTPTSSPRNLDPEARKLIELAAVRHATRHYRSKKGGSRHVRSVERDGIGWDLTVTGPGDEVLKVEVKGCSGTDCIAELTPNEFKQMRAAEHRSDYVVYIVTRANTKQEQAHIFRYVADESDGKVHVWRTQDGRRLKIQELTGARVSCV